MAGEARDLKKIKVQIKGVEKVYEGRNGKTVALNGVNLDIYDNEFICVVGPSGCGKSTLLNIIAGLHEPTAGEVLVNGVKVEGTGVDRGVVFQQYALFPWLTVKKNVEFGLRIKKLPAEEQEAILLASRVVVMSARPGRIKEVIDINIPYPRNQETKMLPEFTELKNYIWGMVYKEYLEVQK